MGFLQVSTTAVSLARRASSRTYDPSDGLPTESGGVTGPPAVETPARLAPTRAAITPITNVNASPNAMTTAIDANDKPICLVVDFDVLTQKDWKSKPT